MRPFRGSKRAPFDEAAVSDLPAFIELASTHAVLVAELVTKLGSCTDISDTRERPRARLCGLCGSGELGFVSPDSRLPPPPPVCHPAEQEQELASQSALRSLPPSASPASPELFRSRGSFVSGSRLEPSFTSTLGEVDGKRSILDASPSELMERRGSLARESGGARLGRWRHRCCSSGPVEGWASPRSRHRDGDLGDLARVASG